MLVSIENYIQYLIQKESYQILFYKDLDFLPYETPISELGLTANSSVAFLLVSSMSSELFFIDIFQFLFVLECKLHLYQKYDFFFSESVLDKTLAETDAFIEKQLNDCIEIHTKLSSTSMDTLLTAQDLTTTTIYVMARMVDCSCSSSLVTSDDPVYPYICSSIDNGNFTSLEAIYISGIFHCMNDYS